MGLDRRYRLALISALLVAAGYAGLTQFNAAEHRASARAQAAEEMKAAADTKIFLEKASALASRLRHPPGFTSASLKPPGGCGAGGDEVSLCFDTAQSPGAALDAYLAFIRPLGLSLQKHDCDFPPMVSAGVRARFGKDAPCSAFGTLGGLNFTVTSVPRLDRSHSTHDHPAWSGSLVSIGFFRL